MYNLYLSRESGGRGLIGANNRHCPECTGLAAHISTDHNSDLFIKIVRSAKNSKTHGITLYFEEPNQGIKHQIDMDHEKKICYVIDVVIPEDCNSVKRYA